MQKWEYEFFSIPAGKEAIYSELNNLGKEGWEVIQLLFDVGLVLCKRPFNVKQEFEGAQALVRSDCKTDYLIGNNEEETE